MRTGVQKANSRVHKWDCSSHVSVFKNACRFSQQQVAPTARLPSCGRFNPIHYNIGANFCCRNGERYLIDGLSDGLRLGDLREKLDIVLIAKELLHPLVLAREGLIHPYELHVSGMHKVKHKNAPLRCVSGR